MKILLIPTATNINIEMQKRFGAIPSVMVPINKQPLLNTLFQQCSEYFDEIIILANEGIPIIETYIGLKNFKKIQLIKVDELKDVGYSVFSGLSYIKKKYGFKKIQKVAINFGDTLIEDYIHSNNENVIAYSETNDYQRWTTFEHHEGKIYDIIDKSENDFNKAFYKVFIGLFSFIDVNCLFESLEKSFKKSSTRHLDTLYSSILFYNEKYSFEILKIPNWIDVGHSDKYIFKTQNTTRFFNHIDIDQKRGVLTKKSDCYIKLEKEILWYLNLPKNLSYLTPRIIDYSINGDKTYIQQDYYSYPTLQEIYVFGNYPLDRWNLIFDSLFFVLQELSLYKSKLPKEKIYQCLHEMYLQKTLHRIEEIRADFFFKELFDSNMIINGSSFKPVNYYLSRINELLGYFKIFDTDEFVIIHGDFCFSNLLYDVNNSFIRIIDPRGSFGDQSMYGDERYEYAKLSHCFNGKYDLIVKDFFYLEGKNNQFDYVLYQSSIAEDLRKLFFSHLERRNIETKQILLIESLLFFSMLPLHKENKKRQLAMLITAVQIIDSLDKQYSTFELERSQSLEKSVKL